MRGGNIIVGEGAVIKGDVYYTEDIVVDERATILGRVERVGT